MSLFAPATREQAKLRLGLVGPAGSGKTYTALRLAMVFVRRLGGRVAVIDSEKGSASKYVGDITPEGHRIEFDTVDIGAMRGQYSVENYLQCLKGAAAAGYTICIVDSLSHAWAGPGGVLEFVDKQSAKNRGNSFAGWRDATPLHNSLIDALLSSPCHLMVTMRSKVEWVVEEDSRGKKVPRKIGMAPVQREGLDYEFDVVGDIEQDTHKLVVTKSRCSALADAVVLKPGEEFANTLLDWLQQGAEPEAPETWDDVAEEWVTRLAEVELGLDEDIAPWCRANKKPLPEDMEPEQRRNALNFFTNGGAETVRKWRRGLTDELRKALMSRWSGLHPIPRKKDGATDEERAAAESASDEHRRAVMRAWWGAESVSSVRADDLLDGPRSLAWLRGLDADAFAAEVAAVSAEEAA